MTRRPQASPEAPPTELALIALDLIDIGEQQLRHDPNDDSITELALDIQKKGLLQPIGLHPTAHGRFQLLFGSRRLAAHQRLRKQTIIARIFETLPADLRIIALVENLHRVDLTLKEECDVIDHLHHHENRSPDSIADLLSKSRPWVMRRLAIPNLPLDLRDPLLEGTLSLGAAEEIARLDDIALRTYLVAQAVHNDMSVDEIKAAVRAANDDRPMREAVETAVAAGIKSEPPPTVHLPCRICGTLKPISELAFIRVCSSGCEETTTSEENADAPNHPPR